MTKHRARKRFGQNFLMDAGVIQRIVQHINPQLDDHLVEIGPGKGALTSLLASCCRDFQVIEIDRDLVSLLQQQFTGADGTAGEMTIHEADALTVDFSVFATTKPARIVGNLPYNISTPLIFHLLSFYDHIQDMYFMLQDEVVERLVAQPGDKRYGRLSVMVGYYCQADKLFEVPPDCFQPQPKVNSAIVRLTPHKPLPHVAIDPDHLKQLVNTVFQQRRKTLRNGLKPIINTRHSFSSAAPLPVDTRMRPENLTVEDYVNLSNFLTRLA